MCLQLKALGASSLENLTISKKEELKGPTTEAPNREVTLHTIMILLTSPACLQTHLFISAC